jgi:hypothetical protein
MLGWTRAVYSIGLLAGSLAGRWLVLRCTAVGNRFSLALLWLRFWRCIVDAMYAHRTHELLAKELFLT